TEDDRDGRHGRGARRDQAVDRQLAEHRPQRRRVQQRRRDLRRPAQVPQAGTPVVTGTETALTQARHLLQVNRPDDAIRLLTQHLRDAPQAAPALTLLAWATL